MELQTVFDTRRSVRSYDEQKTVSKEQIKELVEAGIQAPSWKNSQTARYYCVLDDTLKEQFRKECLPEFNANSSAGAALVVTTFVANFRSLKLRSSWLLSLSVTERIILRNQNANSRMIFSNSTNSSCAMYRLFLRAELLQTYRHSRFFRRYNHVQEKFQDLLQDLSACMRYRSCSPLHSQ